MKTNFVFLFILFQIIIISIPINNSVAGSLSSKKTEANSETVNFTVTVIDKGAALPLQAVVVFLKEGNSIIANASTNAFGRAIFGDIGSGHYQIGAYFIGYNDFHDSVAVDSLHQTFLVKLVEKTTQLKEMVIEGETVNKVATTINIASGQQVFEGETYHAAPSSQMTQLVQENLAGAVRAPTGEVHIRGQHGEFTYLVDGIPIPLGVFGGLNEVVDPKVISRVTFITGGFPAEYGGQITGLMDIQNRVPTGQFHLDASAFVGSYLTSGGDSLGGKVGSFKAVNSNGQSLSLSDHIGKLGYFISGSHQVTDRRIDQPVTQLFHDQGSDNFFYGKFDYLINDNDFLTANLNFSNTLTQVPYDPAEGYAADDQHSFNSFQTLSFYHTINSSSDKETNLFIGAFAREGGLKYIPNINDTAGRIFLNNDSTQSYMVDQDRSFSTYGFRTKYDQSLSHQFKYAFGFNYSYTTGTENFRFFNAAGNKQTIFSDLSGYDLGAFAESEWHPYEWTRLEYGIRYDIHNAPSVSVQYQLDPRIKLNFFLDESNSISLSYSRLFMPTNIENLGSIAARLVDSSKTSPTLPEKDDLYEIAFMRNWKNGFSTKLAGFLKNSSPGLDDQTLGSSTIRVEVNINEIKVRGIELALTYSNPSTPFSGYLNGSIIHAYGIGPVTGGFLPPNPDNTIFDLDHDQRLSAVIGLNYQPKNLFISFSGIYGSGLTNGNSDYVFKTGLFDFNQGAHTTPSWIFNISSGYTFNLVNGQSIEPSLYVNNLFDHHHLLKGAFFSGASFEERRNVVFKLSYHI
jgi:hypothetical protein